MNKAFPSIWINRHCPKDGTAGVDLAWFANFGFFTKLQRIPPLPAPIATRQTQQPNARGLQVRPDPRQSLWANFPGTAWRGRDQNKGMGSPVNAPTVDYSGK